MLSPKSLPPFVRLFSIAGSVVMMATFAACGGGGVSTVPVTGASPAAGGSLVTPNAASGVFAGAPAAHAVGAASSPLPVTTPAGGATLADLAQLLDAAKSPAPGAPIGTVGVITSVGTASFVVRQVGGASPADASNGFSFVNNIPLIGDFSTPLTVNVDAATVFAGVPGLAALQVGAMVAVDGNNNVGALQALDVVPLGISSASPSSAARMAVVQPQARRKAASLGTDVNDVFTRTVSVGPAFRSNGIAVQQDTAPVTCYDATKKPIGTGVISLLISSQAVSSLGKLAINFPFQITYAPQPPQFTNNNGAFSGPGPAADWLNFVPLEGTPANLTAGTPFNPTMDLTVGAALGVTVSISNSCRNAAAISLAQITVGYAIEASTTDAMPGPKTPPFVLDPTACIGLNTPVNVNLFLDPTKGFLPNFSPAGDFTAGNISFCDQPKITGNYVTATATNVTNGSINTSAATFDPGQTGPASVFAFGTLTALGTPLSFSLTNLNYAPVYQDNYRLVYTVFGIPAITLPGNGLGGFIANVASLNAADVPVTLNAAPSGLCESVTSGNAFLGHSSGCAPTADVDFEFCQSIPAASCPGESSGTSGTVSVTEPGYGGTLTIVDNVATGAMGGGCEDGQVSTYPITISPRTANGPAATFTISIGAQQTTADTGCNIYVVDATNHTVEISLQFLGH